MILEVWASAVSESAKTDARSTRLLSGRLGEGTVGTRKDADRAWRAVEVALAAGRPNDPRRGRLTFLDYVERVWFPNHVLEPSTRQSYHYVIYCHLLPTFGEVRMGDILPAHVREWVTGMVTEGRSPATIRTARSCCPRFSRPPSTT